MWIGITEGKADAGKIIRIFKKYMEAEALTIEGMRFEKNLQEKMRHQGFLSDIKPLLPADAAYDIQEAHALIKNKILGKLSKVSR